MSVKQRNIILITTDQQRFDTCGERAPSFMRTPHMNDLARRGVTFSAAYSDCPLCSPARTSIMTGQFSMTHGMMENGASSHYMDEVGTLPSRLRALGYQTCAIGKMHFEPMRKRHGFDEMILPADYYREMEISGYPLRPMRHGLGQNEIYPGMATVPEALTLTSWISEQCLEFVLERRDPTKPFFLWCSYSKPHPPFDPPEPYYSMYRNCNIPRPVEAAWSAGEQCPPVVERTRESFSADLVPPDIYLEARSAYYGLITQIDYNMGRLFSALQDQGLFDESFILFTSDHGEMLGDHRSFSKFFFYEGSAHVPFIVKPPLSLTLPKDRRPMPGYHGTAVNTPVTHADILPTLIAAAGGVADDADGINVMELLESGPEHKRYVEAGLDLKSFEPKGYSAITDGNWKYIWYPEGAFEQLFDLRTDPYERANLASLAEHQAVLQELKEELIDRHVRRNSDWIQGREWTALQVHPERTRDRRTWRNFGNHTEYFQHDVLH